MFSTLFKVIPIGALAGGVVTGFGAIELQSAEAELRFRELLSEFASQFNCTFLGNPDHDLFGNWKNYVNCPNAETLNALFEYTKYARYFTDGEYKTMACISLFGIVAGAAMATVLYYRFCSTRSEASLDAEPSSHTSLIEAEGPHSTLTGKFCNLFRAMTSSCTTSREPKLAQENAHRM